MMQGLHHGSHTRAHCDQRKARHTSDPVGKRWPTACQGVLKVHLLCDAQTRVYVLSGSQGYTHNQKLSWKTRRNRHQYQHHMHIPHHVAWHTSVQKVAHCPRGLVIAFVLDIPLRNALTHNTRGCASIMLTLCLTIQHHYSNRVSSIPYPF